MTVPVGTARIQYLGTGSAGPFAFNFTLYDQNHLKITRTSLLGVDTVLALTTDYTVSIAADFSSATVTLVVPLAGTGIAGSSEKLTIVEDPPISQLVEWSRNDAFPFQTHQRAADLAVLLIGRLNEKVNRSLLLPESSSFSGLTLPEPLASNFLRWNAAGTALENVAEFTPGALTVSPFIQTLLDDTTAALARTTLAAAGYPGASVANRIATWSGTAGKDLLDGGATIANIDPRGKQTIFVPATAMEKAAAAAGPSSAQFTAGVFAGSYLAFDPATIEDAHFRVAMPKSWDLGTITARFYWFHPATATNFGVSWSIFVKAYGDNEAIDGASYGSVITIVDTGGTTNNQYISSESSAVTIGGTPVANDILDFIIRRNATDGSDTLAVDAFLLGVQIFYTTNAPTDA